MTPSLKKNLALSGCFALALISGFVYAAYAHAATTAPDFVEKAAVGNQFEISSSRLALQNSQNDGVKDFARKMIDAHSQMGDQLKSVISMSHAPLKEPANDMDNKHQKMLDDLNKLSGSDFDKKYVAEQVDGHKQTAKLFHIYARKGDDPDLKNFAQQNLPSVEEHLKHADSLQSDM